MQSDDATRLLQDTTRVRRRTRRALNPSWFSNLVFGAFFVGTAVLAAVTDAGGVMLAYWLVGAALAFTATFWFHVRIERELGVDGRAWDASGTLLIALLAGVLVANAVFEGDLRAAMPLYAAAAALTGFAVLWGDASEGAAAAGIALVATAVLVVSPETPGVWANLGLGIVLLAAGVAGRVAWRAPAERS